MAASCVDSYDFDFGSYEPSILFLASDGAAHSATSLNASAKKWFRCGMVWMFGYNHEEAIACFERACQCIGDGTTVVGDQVVVVLSRWLIAYCEGPNYNKPWPAFGDDQARRTAISKARTSIAAAQTAFGRLDQSYGYHGLLTSLISAIEQRYGSQGSDLSWFDGVLTEDELSRWNDRFAEAMEELLNVHQSVKEDLDLLTIVVEALINRTPWALWDLKTGLPQPGSETRKAVRLLEERIQVEIIPPHPGILHMYIHVMEQSPTPESALRASDVLRTLVPDSGHLCHMPSHIDVLCGQYFEARVANELAIVADRKFLQKFGAINFYTLYRSHNYHFRLYAAFFLGQYHAAMDAAEELERTITEQVLRVTEPPMADWLEGFLSVKLHCLIRFGKWQEILALTLPVDQVLYSATTAMTHYAKGVAYAATGKITESEEQLEQLRRTTKLVPGSRTLFNNTCTDLLAIAEQMLLGELEYRKQNFELAFDHLRKSIALEDGLPYDEPWGWMQPVRHAYGALSLEQERVEEALACYRADLGFDDTLMRASHHPNNVWSLLGYVECLQKLGRCCEAKLHKQQLAIALARTDIKLEFSCFCRQR